MVSRLSARRHSAWADRCHRDGLRDLRPGPRRVGGHEAGPI